MCIIGWLREKKSEKEKHWSKSKWWWFLQFSHRAMSFFMAYTTPTAHNTVHSTCASHHFTAVSGGRLLSCAALFYISGEKTYILHLTPLLSVLYIFIISIHKSLLNSVPVFSSSSTTIFYLLPQAREARINSWHLSKKLCRHGWWF